MYMLSPFVSEGNDLNITFDDTAVQYVNSSSPPGGTGTYKPIDALSHISSPQAAGQWKLILQVAAASEAGTLNAWTITFSMRSGSGHSSAQGTVLWVDVTI